jgi:muramoyltetrapeptide carboxypeptidase
MRIGVVAPSTRLLPEAAERVRALAAARFPEAELVFDLQCFLSHNPFAGSDAERADAFVAMANDPGFDALWFARGGYGSCRIAVAVIGRLAPAARDKTYLGYSDAGFMLAGLRRAGFPNLVHGPMPQDISRPGGEAAVARALAWLVRAEPAGLEPGIAAPSIAFNITVLSHLLGTALEPDLAGFVLLLEDVAEHLYRTDRALFHIASSENVRRCAGIRLGRLSDVPENDRDFGETGAEIARHWCERGGIAFLGSADIGHDIDNKIVPFGSPAA